MPRKLVFVLFSTALWACGGADAGASSDVDAADSAHDDTLDDVVSLDSADLVDATDSAHEDTLEAAADTSVGCGTKTCTSGQVCVRTVYWLGDAGPDASGYPSCDPSGACASGQECIGTSCHAVYYGCASDPPTCTSAISCGTPCTTALCAGGWCDHVLDGVVTCGHGG